MLRSIDSCPADRHLEPMSAQHGQTYDPQQERAPRGGWFQRHDRPYPERLDRVSKWAAVAFAGIVAAALAGVILAYAGPKLLTLGDLAWTVAIPLATAAMAYGLARGFGLLLVSLYGTFRDGSEITLDVRAVRHDIRLRRTWIVLLEGALLLAAVVTAAWGLILFARRGEAFGAVTFGVIGAMIYWPLIRRRIAAGRTQG